MKSMRIDVVVLHQPGERGASVVEVRLLHAARLDRVAIEQPLDVGAHALVDQVEQPARRRVEGIVEVEDPVADVGKARVHALTAPLALCQPIRKAVKAGGLAPEARSSMPTRSR